MKLLARSTRFYLAFATVTLLVAIPVFYIAIQRIVLEDVDESLMTEKHELVNRLSMDSAVGDWPLKGFAEILPLSKRSRNTGDTMYTEVLHDTFARENIPYRVLESNIDIKGTPMLIRMKRSLIDGEDLIQSIIIVVIAILAIIVAGMIVINRFSSRRLWSPFYTTLEKLRSFEIEKDNPILLQETKTDEFNDLHRSINALTARSHEAYQSQKAFTENASHEMQTPLAIFRGKLELLMQTQPMTEEQASLISDLEHANRRMNYLNKNLLLLTRIENHQYYEKLAVPVSDTLRRLANQYAEVAAHQSIRFQLNITPDISLQANIALIDILFSNLISNAIRHNTDDGVVNIELTPDGTVIICNTGRNAPLDTARLFKRFNKDSADKDSLGLGLAICQKICEVNEYKLEYTFDKGIHQFQVNFHS